MQETAATLTEVIGFADEKQKKGASGTVYLHEKEGASGAAAISDEDIGSSPQQQIRLVLETSDGSIYYADEFEDMELYQEALAGLEQLGRLYPVQQANEETVEQKRRSG